MKKPLRKTVTVLGIAALLMFGFTFALIPLYNVFCQVTGLNGKIDVNHPIQYSRYQSNEANPSLRRVTVEFDTNRNEQLPCEFTPNHVALQVVPGELTHTSYHVKNLTNKKMIVQAIPSISPGTVAKHFKKLECFCFNQQTLKPGEALDLPLRFWLDPEFPEKIHRLTLSYTLFDVTDRIKESGT